MAADSTADSQPSQCSGVSAPKCQCSHCPVTSPPKHLILCLDGTGNQYSDIKSNVLQFYNSLTKTNANQKVYYHAGIGTDIRSASESRVGLEVVLDAALGLKLVKHVQDAYLFLVQNYESGDKISLFGFSRGAYTVRVLAGFVQKVGLLPRGNESHLAFAWSVFQRSQADNEAKCAAFKKACCIPVEIDFLGVWDTVAALGIFGSELPFAKLSNGGIRVFRQALALDERRAMFKPIFKTKQGHPSQEQRNCDEEQHSPSKGLGNRDEQHHSSSSEGQVTCNAEEVWFAGCHSDVGGGSVALALKDYSLARIPLRWMIRECYRANTRIMFDPEILDEIGFKVRNEAQNDAGGNVDGRPVATYPDGETLERKITDFKETYPDIAGIRDYKTPNDFMTSSGFVYTVIQFLFLVAWSILAFAIRFSLSCLFYLWYAFRKTTVTTHLRKLSKTKIGRLKLATFIRNSWARFRSRHHEELPLYRRGNVNEDGSDNGATQVSPQEPSDTTEGKEGEFDVFSPVYDQLSLRWGWWIIEAMPLPVRRQVIGEGRQEEYETLVNWGEGREIYDDVWNTDMMEYIHVHRSVFIRMQNGPYRPHAWFFLDNKNNWTGLGKFHWEGVTNETKEDNLKTELGWERIQWVD